jgi:hypothetical protein
MKIILKIRREGDRYFAYGWKSFELKMSASHREYFNSCDNPDQRWEIEGFETRGMLFVDKLKKDHKVNKRCGLRKPVEMV